LLPVLALALLLFFYQAGWERYWGSERSIAVLPFDNVGASEESEYFSLGLTEDIITKLSAIQRLSVTSRNSAFRYQNSDKSFREIGKELGVSVILHGSVRREGEKVRISAQLVDVRSDSNLWAGNYDRELNDIFRIQDEIAQNIASALSLTMRPRPQSGRFMGPPSDFQAYDFYSRGRDFFHQARRNSLERALRSFSRAIEIDPDYALAHAGLANTYSWLYMYWEGTLENLENAERASQEAFRLAPDLAEVLVAHGLVASLRGRYDQAEEAFEQALEQDPRLFEAYYFYARSCFSQGKLEQAARLFEQATQTRPDDFQSHSLLATAYGALGRMQDETKAQQQALEIIESHLRRNPEDVRAIYMGAGALVHLGRNAEAEEWIHKALQLEPDEPAVYYNIACVYARMGKIETAVEYLEESVVLGFAHAEWIKHDGDLAPLRDHPGFRSIVERAQRPGS
jgi:TolB-like protein/Flp pilus assembly protein TadD